MWLTQFDPATTLRKQTKSENFVKFSVIFWLGTSDWPRKQKTLWISKEKHCCHDGLPLPKKWLSYEKCFVHPVVAYVKLGRGQGGTDPPLETGVWVWSPPWDPQKFGKIMRLMHKNAIKLKNKAPPWNFSKIDPPWAPTQFNVCSVPLDGHVCNSFTWFIF